MRSGADGPERFIVGATSPQKLAEAIPIIEQDPSTELADVRGPREAPSLLIVNMPPSNLHLLSEQLPPEVIVEPDSPLEMTEGPAGGGMSDPFFAQTFSPFEQPDPPGPPRPAAPGGAAPASPEPPVERAPEAPEERPPGSVT